MATAKYEVVLTGGTGHTSAARSGPGVEILRDERGGTGVSLWTSRGDRIMQMPGVATFTCSPGTKRVTATAEPGISEVKVTEAFHKTIVPLLLYFADHEVLHASAVHGTNGVVGFCADAGTGKSTLAYGLSTRGFNLWADDALGLEMHRMLRAIPLPFDAWLDPQSLTFFERSSHAPVQLAEEETAPVVALAVLTRAAVGQKDVARIERLNGGRAFDEVVKHAYRLGLRTDHARRRKLVENYMKIVASVPVFEIAFQPGFERFAAVLDVVAEWLDADFAQAV